MEEVDIRSHHAVEVQNVCRSYGREKILKDITLTVNPGQIYGLLGPSGCGKTTLMSCVIGTLKIDSGSVSVFGHSPGDTDTIPGPGVGYMPQDIALYKHLSIGEVLSFYGKLHGMSDDRIEERTDFLLTLLNLPPKHRIIRSLSGGQKRRVSFCIALLHEPKLLVLDEPSVGVDPSLRKRMWDHLLSLAHSGTSVIITTHYIEEAAASHVVGLMRDGRLLAQGSPAELMNRTRTQTLEGAFLAYCEYEERNEQSEEEDGSQLNAVVSGVSMPRPPWSSAPSSSSSASSSAATAAGLSSPLLASDLDQKQTPTNEPHATASSSSRCRNRVRCSKVWALLWKNLKEMQRNYGFLLFHFCLPAFQITLYCLAIGGNPKDVPLIVVNNDAGASGGSINLGAQLLTELSAGSAFKLSAYSDAEEGIGRLRRGETYGVIELSSNFTADVVKRFVARDTDPSVLSGSSVHATLDQTDNQIYLFVQNSLSSAYQRMLQSFLSSVHIDPAIASPPLVLEPPVFGVQDATYTDFIAPSICTFILFSQSIALTAVVFVIDKREGTLQRTWACGVHPSEVILAQIGTQSLLLAAQITLVLTVMLGAFRLPLEGSLGWVVLLGFLMGMVGMCWGLVISAVVAGEQDAMQLAIGSVLPMLMVSGVIWPSQAMPQFLYWIGRILPMSNAAEAMRSIMSRGFGLDNPLVYIGFLTGLGWVTVLFFLAMRGLKSKQ